MSEKIDGLIYFEDGELLAESGNVRAYGMGGELYLDIDMTLFTLSSEIGEYVWQMKDNPQYDVLEVGLGLGVASKYLLSFPKVTSLTTVEINKDVINVQKKVNHIDDSRHTIINSDGLSYMYKAVDMYDYIFLDFYSHIDEDTLPVISDMVNASKRVLKDGGQIQGWFDPYTPEEFVDPFFDLFK